MKEPPEDEASLVKAEPRLTSGGSAKAKAAIKNPYYRKVHSKTVLRKAWRIVYESGLRSTSENTRKGVKVFSVDSEKHLDRISRQLRERKFRFAPAEGILKRQVGKKPRPIVLAPIENRIVQRAILDVLQSDPAIQGLYRNVTSFGGIKGEGLGVPGTIRAAYNAIQGGAKFYIRSDIQEFFTKIPRESVLATVPAVVSDSEFNDLLTEATRTELENLSCLGGSADLFPIDELGVAQGCSLSALFGNILLREFDKEMNGRGIVCLRYIDDFILLGPSRRAVFATFANAQRLLGKLGLTAYDPLSSPGKADAGEVKRGIQFLGCELIPGMIRPNKKSKTGLIGTIKSLLDKSSSLMGNPVILARERLSLGPTIVELDHILKGWGNQYSFCNDQMGIKTLDSQIDELIRSYWSRYTKSRQALERRDFDLNSRRLIGVHPLIDSKYDPIIKPSA